MPKGSLDLSTFTELAKSKAFKLPQRFYSDFKSPTSFRPGILFERWHCQILSTGFHCCIFLLLFHLVLKLFLGSLKKCKTATWISWIRHALITWIGTLLLEVSEVTGFYLDMDSKGLWIVLVPSHHHILFVFLVYFNKHTLLCQRNFFCCFNNTSDNTGTTMRPTQRESLL